MRALVSILFLTLLAACGSSGDARSEPPGPTNTRAAAALLTPTPEPQTIRFPEDEAPHDVLTEWWYYTGHLFTEDGTRYGFEYVIFHFQRGAFEPYFAAHVAITDSAGNRFQYAERLSQAAAQPAARGFSLDVQGWTMTGALGNDHLVADMEGFAINLRLTATKPPALHEGDGYVELGPVGDSYYYSRTRMAVNGTLTVDGSPKSVTGEAWFDHQWGNFLPVGAGGWDWFSIQLDTGDDLMIFLVFDEARNMVLSYGTHVRPDGTAVHLESDDMVVTATHHWTSPHTGATYPARWTIELLHEGWLLDLVPSLSDQELRTTASTGVSYWEGEVLVSGTVRGVPVEGLGYVELTGYAP